VTTRAWLSGALCVALSAVACSSGAKVGAPAAGKTVGLPRVGCHGDAPAPEVTNQRGELEVAGTARSFLLTTPPPHPNRVPLVVDFHGYGEGAQTASLTSQFGALGQRDGFVVVFPEGTGHPVAWDTSTRSGSPDLKFIAALLDHLNRTQCIDPTRVYATGLSQGAFMSSTVACAMSTRFAAVAPVDGVVLPKPCRAKRPVPILAFHGTADPILHFNGGLGRAVLAHDLSVDPQPLPKLPPPRLNGPGYPAHVRAWAAKEHCGATPTDTKVSAHVIHRVYRCPHGAVEFYIIIGDGHTWPGSAFSREIVRFVGHTTTEIDATATIWAFFQRHRLRLPAKS